jgi:bifunctional UDP-N-acetylglucosamine pyrophosphorylase / glucosamine-1-phosphate N-acetyltransferase
VSPSGLAAVIVLAAGDGTRMASSVPKVLHRLCGLPMLGHVLAAAGELAPVRTFVVVGDRPEVADYVRAQAPGALIVEQRYRGGTGHAVRLVTEAADVTHGAVLVLYGDTPLVQPATLAALAAEHHRRSAAATILTARATDPAGYGRIIRDDRGSFAAIVEQADATPGQQAITEVNSGMYAFDGARLADVIKRVRAANAQGEEYLTDAVTLLRADGYPVATVSAADSDEVQGINDQLQLARACRVLNDRLLAAAMRAGVTVQDPATTWIEVGTQLAAGSVLRPGTQLEGGTAVAAGAIVGPGCLLRDTKVGAGATVLLSVCESAEVGAGATVGPFAHLTAGMRVPAAGPAPGSTAGPADAPPGGGGPPGSPDIGHGSREQRP